MACRVGITTDPVRRKAEWRKKYPLLTNWQVLEQHSTKASAQLAEIRLAHEYGCAAYQGGREPDTPFVIWSVYKFEH